MADWERSSILFGHSLHIRRLKPIDIGLHPNLRKALREFEIPSEECVAIVGEDLGECLAAVVHLKENSAFPLVWSDADGEGTPIKSADQFRFADSVAFVVTQLIPHVGPLTID